MNDINFFSSFEKTHKDQKKKTRLTWGAVLSVILVIALFYGVMGFRILNLNKEIKAGNDVLNSPNVMTKLTQIQAKKEAIQSLKKYDTEIGKASLKIANSNKVNSRFLDGFQKAFPVTITLKSLDMKQTQLTLQGNAPNLTTAAELTHNLEATGLFNRVQVSSINKDKEGSTYSFDILCDLKEVVAQ